MGNYIKQINNLRNLYFSKYTFIFNPFVYYEVLLYNFKLIQSFSQGCNSVNNIGTIGYIYLLKKKTQVSVNHMLNYLHVSCVNAVVTKTKQIKKIKKKTY